ncbi:MAG: zinc ABC transporter substrate-binding protein [Clostridia bacterium]|nr:zinc ABC transporter substrate-binding protein [Clostridia bacterium]
MKRMLSVLLVLALLVTAFASCSSTKKTDNILLVTSFYPIYIFTSNIVDGIDGIEVECMAEQNVGCLHDYQILSRDAKLISDADVFIINGAGMEEFLEDVYLNDENLRVVDSSENIDVIENCNEHHENHSHDNEEHHEHEHSVNSHIWLAPENAIAQVENIARELSSIYPGYKTEIERNKNSYTERLSALNEELAEAASVLKGKNIITFHESYDYLAEAYSFNVIATVEGHEGSEPSAKGLAELTEIINKNNVSVLFTEPHYKGSAANILCSETGVVICELNPVITGDGSLTSYEDIMRKNIDIIVEAVS